MLRASVTFHRRTLLHDPDAARSWIPAPARAGRGRTSRRPRRRRRTTRGGRPHPVDRRTHDGHAEDRRLLPAVLGRAHRFAVHRDPQARHRDPDEHRPGGRPRIERHRPRPRHGRRRAARVVPARRPARADGAAEHVVPLQQREPARAQVGRGLVRQVGAVGIRGRRREPTAACSSTPPTSCCATSRAPATRCGRATIASIARAARSTWRAPRRSRRTARSK